MKRFSPSSPLYTFDAAQVLVDQIDEATNVFAYVDLGRYGYKNNLDAHKACVDTGYEGLANKGQVRQHMADQSPGAACRCAHVSDNGGRSFYHMNQTQISDFVRSAPPHAQNWCGGVHAGDRACGTSGGAWCVKQVRHDKVQRYSSHGRVDNFAYVDLGRYGYTSQGLAYSACIDAGFDGLATKSQVRAGTENATFGASCQLGFVADQANAYYHMNARQIADFLVGRPASQINWCGGTQSGDRTGGRRGGAWCAMK